MFQIDKIEWLKFIKEESVKWLIISKLIFWFITKYIFLIINRTFFLTVHPAAIGKRLYIKNGKWKTITKHFINDRVNKKVFINVFENKWFSPRSELKLFLKHSGLRPIAKTRYT